VTGRFRNVTAILIFTVAATGCQGGRLAGLETKGFGTLVVKKKSNKDQQIEAIKAEMAREGVAAEQAQAAEEALKGVAEVDDPVEQARLLLFALTEALAASAADDALKEQMAHVVMGAAAELGLSLGSLDSEQPADDELSAARESLLETAASGLAERSVPTSTIVAAASRQLLEAPGATIASVATLVTALPTAAELPTDEVLSVVTAEQEKKAALTRACLDPSKVTAGEEYFCPDGSRRVGAQPVCTQDGEVGCVTTEAARSALVAALASKVLLGQTVAGTAGAVRLPDPAEVRSGVGFGALDAAAGTYSPDFPDPANVRTNDTTNGVTGTYSPDFPDASSVLTSDTTDGVAGTVVLPPAASVLTGTNYGPSSATAGTYTPDFPDAANVRTNDTTNGVTGTYAPDFPTASSVLTSDTTDGVAGTVVLPPAASVLTGTSYGPSSATGGTYSPDFPDASSVLTSDTTDGVAGTVVLPPAASVLTGTSYGPSSATGGTYSPDFPDAANVRAIDTTDGVTGTYVPDFPDAANVRSSDTVNGASGTLGDCTVDGDEGCVVPLSASIKAADTTNLTEWDVRRKRAANGSVITFAGLEGRSKHCRNRANLTIGPDTTNSSIGDLPYNNTTAPASATLVPDFFDTIDDYNDDQTGLPPDIVPWAIPGVAGTHGGDFTCGGIYATGTKNYSDGSPTPTGADATLNHDPNGNWQDLTPGIVPGGAPSATNTNPGCNAADKFCVFRELISGLMVTEVSASYYNWQNAISYCHNLGEAGGVITSPIPTLDVGLGAAHSDWRLPTQKELTHLSTAGIRGLNQTAGLVTLFGNVDSWFWSASAPSVKTSAAWMVNLHNGYVLYDPMTFTNRVVCVR
jgi:hypothetical protein